MAIFTEVSENEFISVKSDNLINGARYLHGKRCEITVNIIHYYEVAYGLSTGTKISDLERP